MVIERNWYNFSQTTLIYIIPFEPKNICVESFTKNNLLKFHKISKAILKSKINNKSKMYYHLDYWGDKAFCLHLGIVGKDCVESH